MAQLKAKTSTLSAGDVPDVDGQRPTVLFTQCCSRSLA
jgi:hypothetical protein